MVSTEHNVETLGVYVSVPFCRAKCSFCNFSSGVGGAAEIEAYVVQLCAEIACVAKRAETLGARLPSLVDSVYFGGGTPSLLTPAQMEKIFASLRASFAVESGAEITMEAAPGQIADELLHAAMCCGVNRVSLGVQSFVDRECSAVGRLHTGRDCVAEVRRLHAAGVQEVGIDLIAGLPHQTLESWRYSLDNAIQLAQEGALTHLSVYMFEVDEDSRLGREVLGGGARMYAPCVPGEDGAAAMYEEACAALTQAGFAQYEISNFAWQGHGGDPGAHESRHNRKYWERKPYVGFGLDAHSMLHAAHSMLDAAHSTPDAAVNAAVSRDGNAVRFANADELSAYGVQPGEVIRVDEQSAFEERVFLGLRLREGVPRRLLAGLDVGTLVVGGLLAFEEDRVKLTTHGMMVANEVFGRLLFEGPVHPPEPFQFAGAFLESTESKDKNPCILE
jgi:oxygen-independent coproporphyrinogen-3 oxidase